MSREVLTWDMWSDRKRGRKFRGRNSVFGTMRWGDAMRACVYTETDAGGARSLRGVDGSTWRVVAYNRGGALAVEEVCYPCEDLRSAPTCGANPCGLAVYSVDGDDLDIQLVLGGREYHDGDEVYVATSGGWMRRREEMEASPRF